MSFRNLAKTIEALSGVDFEKAFGPQPHGVPLSNGQGQSGAEQSSGTDLRLAECYPPERRKRDRQLTDHLTFRSEP